MLPRTEGPSTSAPTAQSTITLTPLSDGNELYISSESEDSDVEHEGAKRGSDSGGNKSEHSGEDAKKNRKENDADRSPRVIIEPEVEKDSAGTSNQGTPQETNANDIDGQETGTGITAAQMKAALEEIMDPTYVAAVKISKEDIRRAEDGLRDVRSLAFEISVNNPQCKTQQIFWRRGYFQKLPTVFRSLYKSKGLMMLKDVRRSDLPKNPMPVPEYVMRPFVWERPPPSEEKIEVSRNSIMLDFFFREFVACN